MGNSGNKAFLNGNNKAFLEYGVLSHAFDELLVFPYTNLLDQCERFTDLFMSQLIPK